MRHDVATVADLDGFDAVIDVRSPAEFAEDHVPGALSCPVQDDEERARVGTLYKQVSPFAARKVGAALVAANIARHVEANFLEHPRQWRPLVYCWRGGKRSGSMTHVLREIGWAAQQLEGGYKSFRRHVIGELDALASGLRFRVICGLTGSGKSRLLRALADRGEPVLDLEAIAAHRGSVLGDLPREPQPSQKGFETQLWQALRKLDPARPVFVESESRKIGNLRVPESLMDRMHAGECVKIEADVSTRAELLLEEYAHFFDDPARLEEKLRALTPLHGHRVVDRWVGHVTARRWPDLVIELLVDHYDPAYTRSIGGHYPAWHSVDAVTIASPSPESFARAAGQIATENART